MIAPFLFPVLLLVTSPPTLPQEDAALESLRAIVREIPHVTAERRGDQLTLIGWTSSDGDRGQLERILERYTDVLDLTTPDVGDPYRMVEVDAILFLVRDSDISSEGFNFLRMLNVNIDLFSSDHKIDGSGLVGPGTFGPVSSLSQRGWMVSASADYDVTIANATDESVAILARPHLTTMNGSSAEFLSGGEIVFQVQGIESGDIKPYPFGTFLKVTPTVLRTTSADGRPRVLVEVEAGRTSILDLFLLDEGLAEDVVFEKVQVTSKAALDFGDTLILSGLYQRERRKVFTGVPILRAIPLVRYLFSTTRELESRSSVIILLTLREPAMMDAQNFEAIDEFVARRREWIRAASEGPEALQRLREEAPEWFQPAPNRYASHFFLMNNSDLYRNIRGEDLSEEALEFDLLEY